MPVLFTKGSETKYKLLPVEKLSPDPDQPRRTFDETELAELTASVRECGLLQPITVRRRGNGFMIIAGERRFRACVRAGLREIPCMISDADDERAAVLSLTENIQRSDLDVFEEAAGIARAMESSGLTQEEIAKKLGRSQSSVANKLRLLKLESELVSEIRKHGLTERHARALLRLPEELRAAALAEIIRNGWNVAKTDEYVDSLAESADKPPEKRAGRRIFIIKDVRLLVNSISKAVGTVKAAGIAADMIRSEDERYITLTITVPKNG